MYSCWKKKKKKKSSLLQVQQCLFSQRIHDIQCQIWGLLPQNTSLSLNTENTTKIYFKMIKRKTESTKNITNYFSLTAAQSWIFISPNFSGVYKCTAQTRHFRDTLYPALFALYWGQCLPRNLARWIYCTYTGKKHSTHFLGMC